MSRVQTFLREGTSQVKNIAVAPRVKVSADGHGVVSHAGMGMLREVADLTGLSAQVTAVLADTYKGPWVYAPGEVFADLAAAVADGADCIDGVGQLCGDREHVFGAKASTTTSRCWYPAIDTNGGIRDGAWVAEATDLVNLSSWPPGTRLILRKERPHPGAQLRFTDADGLRVTAFITDTPVGVVPGQVAGLELRHRQHARVEDRIRELKNTGLRNLPCHAFDANAAWLEIIQAAADLVTWTKLLGFTDHPGLGRAEITTFRYRVLHVAARITRGARQIRLRIDATWR